MFKMPTQPRPLPKWITILAMAVGSLGSLWVAVHKKDWVALSGLLGSLIAGFGHSLTGSGGEPESQKPNDNK